MIFLSPSPSLVAKKEGEEKGEKEGQHTNVGVGWSRSRISRESTVRCTWEKGGERGRKRGVETRV